jgi:hypothetical protein
MSYVRTGMIDGENKERPRDDIRLAGDAKDLACGAVYESKLTGGQKDSQGEAIASDWIAVDMVALLHGARQPAGASVGAHDKCATDLVANPDNISYSETMRTLFVGEDSGNHLNNFTWAFNVDTKKLARIFSAPAGGENTGLKVYDNINGRAYITANVQHPGAAEDLASYPPQIRNDLRALIDQRGIVGYLTGLPAVEAAGE